MREDEIIRTETPIHGSRGGFGIEGLLARDATWQVTGGLIQASPKAQRSDSRSSAPALKFLHFEICHLGPFRYTPTGGGCRHANRIHQAFRAIGQDADNVRSWFFALVRELGRDSISPDLAFTKDVVYPGNVQFNSLVLFGLASVLQQKSDDVIGSLKAGPLLQTLFADDSNIQREARTFCQDPASLGNLLTSFLGNRHEDTLIRLLGSELVQKRFVPAPSIHTARLTLGKLKENPHDTLQWTILTLILEDAQLEPDIKADLVLVIEQLDYAQAFADDLSQGTMVIMLSNRFASLVAEELLRNDLHEQLARVAFEAAKARAKKSGFLLEDEDYMRLCSSLLDATWHLCRISDDPALNSSAFATHAVHIIRCWPEIAEACREQLSALTVSLPAECRAELWPMIFTLRSLY